MASASSECDIPFSSRCEPSVLGPRLPNALPVPFASFNNRYAGGACFVVGRGPTTFDYTDLATIADPIFFINDAVWLEKYARSETFFFAHDAELRVWLDGSIRSTAVLPIDGTVLGDAPGLVLGHAGPVVYYRRGDKNARELLQMGRDELAERKELFVHSGTVHSLLHFVWFCGFRRVFFIGCDGLTPNASPAGAGASGGYDRRLRNRSNSTPDTQYPRIRMAQDLLTMLFGIEAVYHGTPIG